MKSVNSSQYEMKYRPEIDGLRALAVLPVILFHAGIDALSGGFVGVDVFFVISGYLITSIIVREQLEGTFSFRRFYERRARRILPALLLVMTLSIPLSWYLLSPFEMKRMAESTIATLTFTSNFYFWLQSGYFDLQSEMKPLLHTWSLAVEEQFYLFFPVVLLLASKLMQRGLLGSIVVIALGSFATAYWATWAYPTAAFYLLPTRLWELLMGAAAALFLLDNRMFVRPRVQSALSAIGLILIIVSIFAYQKSTPFPGAYALLPTLGSVLIIVFAVPGTSTQKLLSSRPLVSIGLISYSAYLFHQPLFAFARQFNTGEPSLTVMSLLSATSIAAAYFTWLFCEQPFRNKSIVSIKVLIVGCGVVTMILMIFSIGAIATRGYDFRLTMPPNLQWRSLGDRLDAEGDVCDVAKIPDYVGLSSCEFGDKGSTRNVVLYGDSHAQAISRKLDVYAKQNGLKVTKVEITGCGIIVDITSSASARKNPKDQFEKCNSGFNSLQRYIRDLNAVTLLATRWTFQFFPMTGYVGDLSFDNGLGGHVETSYRENFAIRSDGTIDLGESAKREATLKLINGLAGASRYLIVSMPVPETGWDIWQVNRDYYLSYDAPLMDLKFPSDLYYKRNAFIRELIVESSAKLTNVLVLDAGAAFCNSMVQGFCVAQRQSVPFYYDGDHLSDEGAKLVVDRLGKILRSVRW